MKSFYRLAVVLLIASLASVAAFAKTRSEKVSFLNDIKVNGTLVKKGVYDLKFDDKTREVSIVKNGKVIARANTTVEKRQIKARGFEWQSALQGESAELVHIAFAGSTENFVLNSSAASR